MDDSYCQRIAAVGRALSDPCRVAILMNFKGRTLSISTMTEEMDTYQSNLCYHVSILYKAGLLQRVDMGRWHYYAVDQEAISELGDFSSTCCKKAKRRKGPDNHGDP